MKYPVVGAHWAAEKRRGLDPQPVLAVPSDKPPQKPNRPPGGGRRESD